MCFDKVECPTEERGDPRNGLLLMESYSPLHLDGEGTTHDGSSSLLSLRALRSTRRMTMECSMSWVVGETLYLRNRRSDRRYVS
jgi:hypothetical protein